MDHVLDHILNHVLLDHIMDHVLLDDVLVIFSRKSLHNFKALVVVLLILPGEESQWSAAQSPWSWYIGIG